MVYVNQVSEVAYGSIRRCLKSRPQTMYYITGKQLQQMIFHSCKKAELYNWWEYEEYFSMLELKLFFTRGHWGLTKLREWKRIAVLDFSYLSMAFTWKENKPTDNNEKLSTVCNRLLIVMLIFLCQWPTFWVGGQIPSDRRNCVKVLGKIERVRWNQRCLYNYKWYFLL